MALKVKAVERLLKFDKNDPGSYRYVLKPELYTSLDQKKVIREAALRSGVSQGVMKACWDAAGEVIKAWMMLDAICGPTFWVRISSYSAKMSLEIQSVYFPSTKSRQMG